MSVIGFTWGCEVEIKPSLSDATLLQSNINLSEFISRVASRLIETRFCKIVESEPEPRLRRGRGPGRRGVLLR